MAHSLVFRSLHGETERSERAISDILHSPHRAVLGLLFLCSSGTSNPHRYNFRLQAAVNCFRGLFDTPDGEGKSLDYFNEGLTDHVALLVSWDALQIHLKHFPSTAQRLPTRSALSSEKMFFISRAYVWCHATNDFYWQDYGSHPPGFHRANRGFSNDEDFQRTFECDDNDNMVAKTHCKLFGD